MKSLAVELPDPLAAAVEAAAQRTGVSAEELLRISVEEKLARDAAFDEAARRVLDKNAELYQRLS